MEKVGEEHPHFGQNLCRASSKNIQSLIGSQCMCPISEAIVFPMNAGTW